MTDDRSAHPVAVEVLPAPRTTADAARPADALPDAAPGGGGSPSELVAQITAALSTAAARGDLDTVRALHAALAGVLGTAPAEQRSSGARVVPLRGRGKRGAQ
ncbi:hypothetical protein BE17_07245 [Sorangium cellulosum]|uniref:Uncharacterized protein n=1 Tax=Sorangium cellulosum TaxID=56 RepID=A0A150S549_SORCE|nr:hypothetical protein BE17_07245 [Sorangium cellulosum]